MTSLWKSSFDPPRGTPFAAGARHDVVVVGAGITGLSTALMLARGGMDVALVEAGDLAQLATGSNTGKLSLLQGSVLSTMRRRHPASLVRAYVEANRAGAEWLTSFLDSSGVSYTRSAAYSYAQGDGGMGTVDAEVAAGREAGLPVRFVSGVEMPPSPFPVVAAAALDDQVAVDPAAAAAALASEFLAAGGTLHTKTRVMGVHATPHARVDTTAGPLFGTQIVLATGTPIADRGLYFAKVRALRSYCVSFRTGVDVPDGLYISVDGPTRSIRRVTPADGPAGAQLVIGGAGHPVGRAMSERGLVEELVGWAKKQFPDAEETHRWSAQDYESHNLVPFVGALPRGLGRIRFATGYAKWGLSNGPAAALRLAAEIRGDAMPERPRWMLMLGTRVTVPADLARGAIENARVAREAAGGWLGAESTPVPVPRPPEGEGTVASNGGRPVAISTTGGETRAVSAVCTHLGGVLSWNDAECTWDCPLHGSRFAPDGVRLEGPADRDLRRLPRSPGGAGGAGAADAPDGESRSGAPLRKE
ncbi:MAG TPA: FAD-dependent oxidoreductase [Microbacterium sp.]|uniref:FAD-dependent oxidoreductase n=1 Tax=Microbacterium sp. TaxID=51671 RepID=UPI002C2DA6B6|nr:FAD-dependent oxidoreductase [Microbacterium sp.]HWI30121.1 FAD-dependent oxidoreductase [Microbacterium sp.]